MSPKNAYCIYENKFVFIQFQRQNFMDAKKWSIHFIQLCEDWPTIDIFSYCSFKSFEMLTLWQWIDNI